MKQSATERANNLGWGGMKKTIMTIHDVPFRNNPEEMSLTERELEDTRQGFDEWLREQGNK